MQSALVAWQGLRIGWEPKTGCPEGRGPEPLSRPARQLMAPSLFTGPQMLWAVPLCGGLKSGDGARAGAVGA